MIYVLCIYRDCKKGTIFLLGVDVLIYVQVGVNVLFLGVGEYILIGENVLILGVEEMLKCVRNNYLKGLKDMFYVCLGIKGYVLYILEVWGYVLLYYAFQGIVGYVLCIYRS